MHTPHSPPLGGREKENAPRDKAWQLHAEQCTTHERENQTEGAVLLYRSLFEKSIEREKNIS